MATVREVERVRSLVELAGRRSTPRHEAETAGVAACRMIRELGLVVVRNTDEINGVGDYIDRGVLVDGPLAVIAEHDKAYRLAHLRRQWIAWVPKAVILEEWDSDREEDVKAWGRVLRALKVETRWWANSAPGW